MIDSKVGEEDAVEELKCGMKTETACGTMYRLTFGRKVTITFPRSYESVAQIDRALATLGS